MGRGARVGRVGLIAVEALAGDRGFGIDPSVVDQLTDEIRSIVEMGVTLDG